MIKLDYSKANWKISAEELDNIKPALKAAHETLHNKCGAGNDYLGWIDLPVNYDKITTIAGTYTPNTVIPCDNKSYDYWFRSLFQRAQSVIRIDNTPSNWDVNVYNFLFWCLFKDGYVAVFHNNGHV
jgi:hypothetical protein